MVTFQLPTTTDDRVACLLSRSVALSGKSRLYRSHGRRKAGRKTKYTISLEGGRVYHFEAFTDEEAIEKANKRIEKEAAKAPATGQEK